MSLMSPGRLLRRVASPGAALAALLAAAEGAAQGGARSEPQLGTITFPTSGAAAAQPHFVRGVLYLHSFEYEDAAKAFREAQRLDPGFAMAYWGEAMTHTHPVWNQQSRDSARAVLARLAPTAAARRAAARTPREQRYLDAVETLYGEGAKERRDTLYAEAMARLAAEFPEDAEAAAFHALALLGLNQAVRHVPTYMRAAAIAEEVFRDNPRHPGAAHYLIHSYDDPVHAPLGLRAARAYADIAPAAGHAQHMTSHIFLALGMWDDVVRANEAAWETSGKRNGHYTYWLAYGYLQQGRYADARRFLEAMRADAQANPHPRNRYHLAAMRAAYVVETQQWDGEVARWRVDTAGSPFVALPAAFADGYAAAMRGDRAGLEAARAAVARYALGGQPRDARPLPYVGTGLVMTRVLSALVEASAGRTDEAVALLRQAGAIEDSIPYEFGPPEPAKPPRELAGELLLAANRPAEAKREFELALLRAPRRVRSLLLLARAYAALGDWQSAARTYAEVRTIWRRAEKGLPELAEVEK